MKKITEFCAKHSTILIIIFLAIAIVYPLVAKTGYLLRLGITCLMYSSMAVSLNLIIGNLGQMTMGHSAFMGIGAYTAAILSTRLGLSSSFTLLAAVVVTGIFSLLLGLPVLKLKGYYLTVVTLGFCEIIRLVELNWTSLTRGALGISNIPSFSFFGNVFRNKQIIFYFALVLLIFTVLVIKNLLNSNIGLSIQAIKDDEIAASSLGINVFRVKMIAFIISGLLAGLVGAFYAHYVSYIDSTLFTTGKSMDFAIFAIFGGLGSIPGAIGGAIILTILPEALRFLATYRTFIYGVIIIILMLFKPEGILGNVSFKYIKQRQNMALED
jgi:branched-chain amino acid transport system permease protein